MGNACCDSEETPNNKPQSLVRPKRVQEKVESAPQTSNNDNQKMGDKQIQDLLNAKAKVKKKIEFDDFQIDGKIGQGGFGVVYLAQLKENISNGIVEKYAIKKVSKQLIMRKRVSENAKLEKEILATYSCKFIVALVMAFQDTWYVYFVMECAMGGDTYSLIKKHSIKLTDYKALGEAAVRFIAACVILGLEYLHKRGIMYRDLKPQNVLLFQNGYAKITDFGLAKKSIDDQLSKTISGTPFYYAPQMVLKQGYNKDVDLWTLGVYLYELSVLQPPFTTEQISRAKFKGVCLESEKNRNWKSSNLSLELKDLISELLRFDPKKRLGADGHWDDIKNHGFFRGFDWAALQNSTMQSPLKKIAGKYPIQVKTYKPTKQEIINNTGDDIKIEGWTFVKPNQRKM